MSGSIRLPGSYLLDTNVAIAVLESEVDLEHRRGSRFNAFLNTIVLGELLFGAEKSRRVMENVRRVEKLTALCPVLPCDAQTARHYGKVRKSLLDKGRPIPENDLWIAASAWRFGLTLVTRDSHFREVEGLEIESW